MMFEKRLGELIDEAKQAGLSCRDFAEMAEALWK